MNIFEQNNSTKKTLKITTLSHLNIGCGDFYTNLDYYIEGSKAKIIDMGRLLESLDDANKIDELVKLIKSNEAYESINIYPDKFILKEIDCKIKEDASVQIKKFINQNGKYYVPGSSLKGAIRTAYIFDYYDKHMDELVKILRNKNIKNYQKGNEIVKNAIGSDKDDFKYLLITDSNFIDSNNFEFIETRRYNIEYKRKNKSNIYGNKECKEALKKGSEFTIELTIKKGFPNNFEEIKNMCNNLTRTIIQFEMKNSYLPQGLKDFYKNKILNDLNNNNAFYLALGSGSGFLSKTIYLLLWKHNEDLNLVKGLLPTRNDRRRKKFQRVDCYLDFPRTRVLYKDRKTELPMGWVKITYQ